MATTRKTSLNARQRARRALQDDMEKLKKREDLLVEVLTAADARDAAEVRLGEALNALRGLGMSQAEMAERTGLVTREISAAMRAANEDDELEDDGDDPSLDDEVEGGDESSDEVEEEALEAVTDGDEGEDLSREIEAVEDVDTEEELAESDDVKSRYSQPFATA